MAEQEEMFETDEVVAAEDSTDKLFEQKDSVVAFVQERYRRAEDARHSDEQRWLKHIVTIVVYTVQMFLLQILRSLACLLKLPRLRLLLPTDRL